jgi:hypothetical protein
MPDVCIPPDYDTFRPPGVWQSYADPVFGTSIKRISDAMATSSYTGDRKLWWISDEYSTASPFNLDNSKILLVHESIFALYDGDGRFLRYLDVELNASSEPRWSRHDAEILFYCRSNQLKRLNVVTGEKAVIRTFKEYEEITGKGESDISADGDRMVFAGDRRYVFVYDLAADKCSPPFDTMGNAFDSLYISASSDDNEVTITWDQAGTARLTGIELFDGRDMKFIRQLTRAGGHMDITTDDNGACLVWCNANDPKPIAPNAVVKVPLVGSKQSVLAEFDWSLAVHVSAPDMAGFVYVETYAPSNPISSDWKPYTNELLKVALDGSGVTRLAHHRSRSFRGNKYNWQPRMSCSRDGSRIVFNSDFNLEVVLDYPEQYCDVYMIGAAAPAIDAPVSTEAQAAGFFGRRSKPVAKPGFGPRARPRGEPVKI